MSKGKIDENPFRGNYDYLSENMDGISRILGILFDLNVMNNDKMLRIRELSNRGDQAREILDYMARRPADDLPKFLHVLRQTGNGHLADRIDGSNPKSEKHTPTPPPPYVRSPTPPPSYEQVQSSPPSSSPEPVSSESASESVGTISPGDRVLTPTQHRVMPPGYRRGDGLLTPSHLRSGTRHGGNEAPGQRRTPACTPITVLGVIKEN